MKHITHLLKPLANHDLYLHHLKIRPFLEYPYKQTVFLKA